MQQQLKQISNQLGILLRVDDNRNQNNGVNQVGDVNSGRPPINPVPVNPRRPMMEDSDDEDDLGYVIAKLGGKGVRRNAQ